MPQGQGEIDNLDYGPFSQYLTQPYYNPRPQQASGWEGKGGQVANLVSSFMQGFSQARARQFAQSELEKHQQLQALQGMQQTLAKSGLDPEFIRQHTADLQAAQLAFLTHDEKGKPYKPLGPDAGPAAHVWNFITQKAGPIVDAALGGGRSNSGTPTEVQEGAPSTGSLGIGADLQNPMGTTAGTTKRLTPQQNADRVMKNALADISKPEKSFAFRDQARINAAVKRIPEIAAKYGPLVDQASILSDPEFAEVMSPIFEHHPTGEIPPQLQMALGPYIPNINTMEGMKVFYAKQAMQELGVMRKPGQSLSSASGTQPTETPQGPQSPAGQVWSSMPANLAAPQAGATAGTPAQETGVRQASESRSGPTPAGSVTPAQIYLSQAMFGAQQDNYQAPDGTTFSGLPIADAMGRPVGVYDAKTKTLIPGAIKAGLAVPARPSVQSVQIPGGGQRVLARIVPGQPPEYLKDTKGDYLYSDSLPGAQLMTYTGPGGEQYQYFGFPPTQRRSGAAPVTTESPNAPGVPNPPKPPARASRAPANVALATPGGIPPSPYAVPTQGTAGAMAAPPGIPAGARMSKAAPRQYDDARIGELTDQYATGQMIQGDKVEGAEKGDYAAIDAAMRAQNLRRLTKTQRDKLAAVEANGYLLPDMMEFLNRFNPSKSGLVQKFLGPLSLAVNPDAEAPFERLKGKLNTPAKVIGNDNYRITNQDEVRVQRLFPEPGQSQGLAYERVALFAQDDVLTVRAQMNNWRPEQVQRFKAAHPNVPLTMQEVLGGYYEQLRKAGALNEVYKQHPELFLAPGAKRAPERPAAGSRAQPVL